jgi:DNA replication and repair protein RecF
MRAMSEAASFAEHRVRPMARRAMLRDFRSYAALDIAFDGAIVVLCGENGAGKTNLIEALSLFAPGRGLRRADTADCARVGGAGGFAVSATIESDGAERQLGIGLESGVRQYRIDRAPVASARAFADHLRIVWLTPAMDGLFLGPAGDRRRFLDRLVLAVDPGHGARVAQFERVLRGRNRVLEEDPGNGRWLDAIERETAELAIAIAAARVDCTTRLRAMIALQRDDASPFPWADLELAGEVESLVAEAPALAAEERYRAVLREGRARDAAAGRTLVGPHLADLQVRHGTKQTLAAQASTGEQKALLVGLVLAHARLVAEMSGIAPWALIDEVAAHFDPRRRLAIFDALERIGGQVFLTGADPAVFADLSGRATMIEVTPGRARVAAW